MGYIVNVPNASQSPGLFPTQNNENFSRLKTIINADHVFNDAAQATDGIHRQVSMSYRAIPVVLPSGVNAILYTALDSLSRPQLYFYNGIVNVQLTPPDELYPIRVTGSASLTAGGSTTAYADPGFTWAGTGYALLGNTATFTFYQLLRSGVNDGNSLQSGQDAGLIRPTFNWSGNDLLITNNDITSRDVSWSLIINRLPA